MLNHPRCGSFGLEQGYSSNAGLPPSVVVGAMYGFSGGALLKDVEKARQEMDQVNAQLGATRRQAMARAARQREKAELRSALAGKKRLLSAAAKGSVLRLNRGHGEDSARAADEALITATFRKFDVDGSGSIDVAELGDALQMVLGKRPNRETVKQLFAIADTDGNGTLDFEEFSQLARKGELVNRKLLNPKYRFLMQARHERAAERDAQAAALAAKKAQIEEAGRRIDETRAEWELVCAARRRENAAEHRRAMAAKAAWLAERDRSGLHRQAMAAKRRAANLRTYRKNATTGSDAVRAKRALALQGTLYDVCRTTMHLVGEDDHRKRVTTKLGLDQQRYYVGSRQDEETLRKSESWRQPHAAAYFGESLVGESSIFGASADVLTAAGPAPSAEAAPSRDGDAVALPAPPRSPLGSPGGFDPAASVSFHPSVQFNDLAASSVLSPNPLFDPLASASVLSPMPR